MKISKLTIALVLTTTLLSANVSAADSKQKPPVADSSVSVSWYQSVMDYFGF